MTGLKTEWIQCKLLQGKQRYVKHHERQCKKLKLRLNHNLKNLVKLIIYTIEFRAVYFPPLFHYFGNFCAVLNDYLSCLLITSAEL